MSFIFGLRLKCKILLIADSRETDMETGEYQDNKKKILPISDKISFIPFGCSLITEELYIVALKIINNYSNAKEYIDQLNECLKYIWGKHEGVLIQKKIQNIQAGFIISGFWGQERIINISVAGFNNYYDNNKDNDDNSFFHLGDDNDLVKKELSRIINPIYKKTKDDDKLLQKLIRAFPNYLRTLSKRNKTISPNGIYQIIDCNGQNIEGRLK